MAQKPEIDVPEDWRVIRYESIGQKKLVAKFKNRHTGWEVNIVPYRNYETELSNYHRVTLTKDDSVEVVAEALEVEHADHAETVAIETMETN